MKDFREIIEDLHKLIGFELYSLSEQGKKIKITEVKEDERRVYLLVESIWTASSSFDDIEKIINALKENVFVHVDSILNNSNSSTNYSEAIMANLPYIEYAQYKEKQCLVYVRTDTHKIGTLKKMSKEEMVAFEWNYIQTVGSKYKKAAISIKDYMLASGFSFEKTDKEIQLFYDKFTTRFSPEQLEQLSGNELLTKIFYTADSTNDSMCYWLEFHKEIKSYFGSISGGSAYKFGLFQKKDYTWVCGSSANPEELSEEDAIAVGTAIRDNLIKGAKIIKSFKRLISVADYEELDKQLNNEMGKYADMVWIHKYYHMIFPDKFATFHSSEWQRHLLYAYEIKPSERYYGRSGQLAIISNLAELSLEHFAEVSYNHFGNIRQFYRIGTSDSNGNYFNQWLQKHIVAIGWPKCGSLEKYGTIDSINKKEVANKLQQEYYPNDTRQSSRKAGELIKFYKSSTNTIFVAMNGEKLLGLGDEIGEYYFDKNLPFAHTKSINWNCCFEKNEKLPNKSEGLRTSCYTLQDDDNLVYLYSKYFGKKRYSRITDKESEGLNLEIKDEKPKEETVKEKEHHPRVNVIHPLNQIIFGAPGTGKTYFAVEFAIAIIENRPVNLMLTSIEERKKLMEQYNKFVKNGQIVFTTFHQSYGYEEFIQGIRPEEISGNIGFKKTDGIFKMIAEKAFANPERNYVIIIDEINRGNISKIFGELITLIEDDKRYGEINQLSVTLPLGDAFTVPNNLYIVGTMNSADKSISLLDTAIRRRFDFIEMPPNPSTIENMELRNVLQNLNSYLKKEFKNTDLLIGHSYFIGKGLGELCNIMNRNIIPLLYEYFYEDEGKVKKALDCLKETNVIIDKSYTGRIRIKEKDGLND